MITLILLTLLIIVVIGFFWPISKEDVYTYVQEKDEEGNTVEKVIDHRNEDK